MLSVQTTTTTAQTYYFAAQRELVIFGNIVSCELIRLPSEPCIHVFASGTSNYLYGIRCLNQFGRGITLARGGSEQRPATAQRTRSHLQAHPSELFPMTVLNP
jgi:hypothetical protein